MSNDIFDRFSPKPANPATPKEPYVAYGLVKPTKPLVRLDLYRTDGSVFSIDNANLCNVISTHERFVSLVYDRCIIELRGRHLPTLIDLLLYYEIRFAECFHPEKHRFPAENHALIDRIRWKPVLHTQDRAVPAKEAHTNVTLVRME